ncbi:hypothetical protein [Acuticoccus sediminis]|nr:hypothetical protein [Acuticoccus sediminis]
MDVIDDKLGERFEIVPRLPGNSRNLPGDDPGRESATVTGVMTNRSGEIERGAYQGKAWGGEVPADYATLSIQHALAPGYVRTGDHVRALDRSGTPLFEVAQVMRSHRGRLVFRVTPLSLPQT